jgi:hypothetical protein
MLSHVRTSVTPGNSAANSEYRSSVRKLTGPNARVTAPAKTMSPTLENRITKMLIAVLLSRRTEYRTEC